MDTENLNAGRAVDTADRLAALERLSALLDGEADAAAARSALAAWRDEPEARAAWHCYHLIGDALRSDELATPAAHDRIFIDALRVRLADEPVVLVPPSAAAAPAAVAPVTSRRGRWLWAAPGAVAAGFVAVAAVVLVTRTPPPAAPTMASNLPSPQPERRVAVSPPPVVAELPPLQATQVPSTVGTVTVMRDAGLDSYLAAHKQFADSSALRPSALLRSATAAAPGR